MKLGNLRSGLDRMQCFLLRSLKKNLILDTTQISFYNLLRSLLSFFICNQLRRCRFDVNLADNTGNVTATLFGELAEKLLTYSALDAMQYFIRNVELPLEHVHEALKTKLFAVQIQPAQSRYGYLQQRYTVVHFYEENQGEENKSPSTSICINMASNFDETDNLGVTSPLAGFETAQISTTKKTKLALC
ncbi:uncharacterized protein [Coffea arabica]|uniref:Uncharacterized protein isoform X1 n=1 Tax=Coffea arabica TaxID=13443 RepID=A0ABM4UH14_COFAR